MTAFSLLLGTGSRPAPPRWRAPRRRRSSRRSRSRRRARPARGAGREARRAAIWIFDGTRAVEAPGVGRGRRRCALARRRARSGRSTSRGDAPVRAPGRGGRRSLRHGRSAGPSTRTRTPERTAFVGAVVLALALLGAVALLSRWMLGRALRPVSRMTADAAAWSDHDLDRRFDVGEPYDELTRLAHARRAARADRGEPPPRAAFHCRALARAADPARAHQRRGGAGASARPHVGGIPRRAALDPAQRRADDPYRRGARRGRAPGGRARGHESDIARRGDGGGGNVRAERRRRRRVRAVAPTDPFALPSSRSSPSACSSRCSTTRCATAARRSTSPSLAPARRVGRGRRRRAGRRRRRARDDLRARARAAGAAAARRRWPRPLARAAARA